MMFWLIFIAWLMFNGKVTIEICVIGLILSAAVYAFYRKFLAPEDQKGINHLKRLPLYVRYFFLLVWEIIKANIAVLKIALSPKVEFSPRVIWFETDLKEEISRTILANSITLTPGTITAQLEGNRYCVHCLDASMGEGIEESSFVQLLRKIEEVR